MEETPEGTPVGVDDPYAVAGRCDHLTDDGRCRYALEHAGRDPEFAADRRADDYACVVAETEAAAVEGEDPDWSRCPHYRSTTDAKECARCGLAEVRLAHDADARPLVEEHHLSYGAAGDGRPAGDDGDADDDDPAHEITVGLCRWCHTKVHRSFARVDDDATPDPEALAVRETRRGEELSETGFQSASERREE
ncbi:MULTISPECIES: DUF7097 family protein [Halolamina]|uniref:Uncharacterized protein n=1 Tax=Halolamina pelagica TaxID=699431 RepID=A0A1I5SHD7_9EURY|nr:MULTISPECIES: hypothetical protein [Halolamina]NHX37059.1 hypothetical protein [Halolamina sp. R1-12]SFP70135.1 hypothetical protein SAMN05216277_106118 [Halolamina pelagica]